MTVLFFYGTLRDALVRERVIGRAGETGSLRAAFLPDFVVRRVRGTAYPMLVASPGGRVAGLAMLDLTLEEVARLDRFEGLNYGRVAGEVDCAAVGLKVEFYLPRRSLPEDRRPWVFEQWQIEDRAAFFDQDFDLAGVRPPTE